MKYVIFCIICIVLRFFKLHRMTMYNFIILIDLAQVCKQNKNYNALLDIFGSTISSLEYTILNLSLSTRVKRNKSKYIIYFSSPSKICVCIKSPLICVYPPDTNSYKRLSKSKSYFTLCTDKILLLSDPHVRYILEQIRAYVKQV